MVVGIAFAADSERAVRFFDVFYKVEGMKSGMHHPDGMLWVRTPEKRHQIHRDKVPLESIAPTILEMFGVTPPSYMKGPLLKDLLPARTMA